MEYPEEFCGISCIIVWNTLQNCVEYPEELCGISCRIVWNILQNYSFPFIAVNILRNIVITMYTENMTTKQDKSGVFAHTWAKGQHSLLSSDNNILETAFKTNSSLECNLVTRKPVTYTRNKYVSDGTYQLTCLIAVINSRPDGKSFEKIFWEYFGNILRIFFPFSKKNINSSQSAQNLIGSGDCFRKWRLL
jgi:hypothetical protein